MSFDARTFLAGLFKPESGAGLAEATLTADPAIGPDDLPPEWRERYEERAAIREYDGGQAREHAEAEALRETLEAMRRAAGRPT
ncbi:MAG TPA: hypothetical protein VLM89_06030 [Phycisphaerae bacterium]|nr:hypothetical protein [Phycisphaerae bacterium]